MFLSELLVFAHSLRKCVKNSIKDSVFCLNHNYLVPFDEEEDQSTDDQNQQETKHSTQDQREVRGWICENNFIKKCKLRVYVMFPVGL